MFTIASVLLLPFFVESSHPGWFWSLRQAKQSSHTMITMMSFRKFLGSFCYPRRYHPIFVHMYNRFVAFLLIFVICDERRGLEMVARISLRSWRPLGRANSMSSIHRCGEETDPKISLPKDGSFPAWTVLNCPNFAEGPWNARGCVDMPKSSQAFDRICSIDMNYMNYKEI